MSLNRDDKTPTIDKPLHQGNFSKKNRLQNFPYNTNWKDRKPSIPLEKDANEKVTLDPLQRASINIVDDLQWCMAYQLPYAPKYCAVALSFSTKKNEEEDRLDHQSNSEDV